MYKLCALCYITRLLYVIWKAKAWVVRRFYSESNWQPEADSVVNRVNLL
jgi:hypothetical protein